MHTDKFLKNRFFFRKNKIYFEKCIEHKKNIYIIEI